MKPKTCSSTLRGRPLGILKWSKSSAALPKLAMRCRRHKIPETPLAEFAKSLQRDRRTEQPEEWQANIVSRFSFSTHSIPAQLPILSDLITLKCIYHVGAVVAGDGILPQICGSCGPYGCSRLLTLPVGSHHAGFTRYKKLHGHRFLIANRVTGNPKQRFGT